MKVTLFNNICRLATLRKDQPERFLSRYLTAIETVMMPVPGYGGPKRYERNKVETPLYQKFPTEYGANYYFPMGLWKLIPEEVKQFLTIETAMTSNINMDIDRARDWEKVKTILQPESGFDLRDDQIISVLKILKAKRGVHESSTGSGKTEIISACIKMLSEKYPDIHILVVEPTDILVGSTVKRMKRYGIDAEAYKKKRGEIVHTVTVSHPLGLLKDAKKYKSLLSPINAVFWDECHHIKADTWTQLNLSVMNAEYSVGLSALAIDTKHKFETDVRKLSLDEALILGATGKLISYIPAGYYIAKGILAQPIILQLHLDSELPIDKQDNDWQNIRQTVLESHERTSLFNFAVSVFAKYGRKSLMLVGTKLQAFQFAKGLCETYGLMGKIGIAYSGVCYLVDSSKYAKIIGVKSAYLEKYESPEEALMHYILENPITPLTDEEFEKCIVKSKESTVDLFDEGKISILLATTLLDEGVDVDSLDAVFLTGGGKKSRRIIQRVGRTLRKSKTGKYAYVVDMVESCNKVLVRQASERMKTYREELQLPDDKIYTKISPDQFEFIFRDLEDIHIGASQKRE